MPGSTPGSKGLHVRVWSLPLLFCVALGTSSGFPGPRRVHLWVKQSADCGAKVQLGLEPQSYPSLNMCVTLEISLSVYLFFNLQNGDNCVAPGLSEDLEVTSLIPN